MIVPVQKLTTEQHMQVTVLVRVHLEVEALVLVQGAAPLPVLRLALLQTLVLGD